MEERARAGMKGWGREREREREREKVKERWEKYTLSGLQRSETAAWGRGKRARTSKSSEHRREEIVWSELFQIRLLLHSIQIPINGSVHVHTHRHTHTHTHTHTHALMH